MVLTMSEVDSAPFAAAVHRTGDMAVLVLRGLLDRRAEEVLDTAVDEALQNGPPVGAVGVDCTDLHYINSSGIALVVGLLARARTAALPVRVWGLSDHFRHIFEITRLADHLTFFPDETAAAGGVPAPV